MPLPPPLLPLQCKHEDCTLPDGGQCALSFEIGEPQRECPHLVRQEQVDIESASPVPAMPAVRDTPRTASVSRSSGTPRIASVSRSSGAVRVTQNVVIVMANDAAPWSGRHLDRETTERLLWASPARLIAVVGPFAAGKTSLLASFFLQLANGQCRTLPYRFAFSRTLHGFHDLLDKVRAWDRTMAQGDEHDMRADSEIVGHTPKQEGADRFLHVGLCPRRDGDRRHVDVLLSDVAGEWFSDFTRLADDSMRERMAFLGRCDGFLVVADAADLLGPSGRKLDAEISRMIRRVIEFARPQHRPPLALVLSKYDRIVAEAMPPDSAARRNADAWGPLGPRARRIWNALGDAEKHGMPVGVFPVSAFPGPLAHGQPVGVDAPFAFVLQHADRRERWPQRVQPVPEGASSFAAMRRWPQLPEGKP